MNKVEFLDNLDRLDEARKKAKKDFEAFTEQLEKEERKLKNAYAKDHAPFKVNELVLFHDYGEDVVDTIYSVGTRVVTTTDGPVVCFDSYRTGNNSLAIAKDKIEKIPEDEQKRLWDEAMSKKVCKVGDDVLYYRSSYKVIGIYARSYKGEIYPVYRMRNTSSGYIMFANTHDFRVGNCTVVNAQKVDDCQGIAI